MPTRTSLSWLGVGTGLDSAGSGCRLQLGVSVAPQGSHSAAPASSLVPVVLLLTAEEQGRASAFQKSTHGTRTNMHLAKAERREENFTLRGTVARVWLCSPSGEGRIGTSSLPHSPVQTATHCIIFNLF